MYPLTRPIELGDVFQIHNGMVQPLMNILQVNLVEDILVSPHLELNSIDWRLKSGIRQTYCTDESIASNTEERDSLIENDVEAEKYLYRTRQVLSAKQSGDFVFHGYDPICRLILNWHKFEKDATLKLTQSHYTFRDIYVITGVATVRGWGLIISGAADAQLEMIANTKTTDIFNLISHESVMIQESRNISIHEHSSEQPAYFFRAKKLKISDKMYDQYLTRLLENNSDLSRRSIANWLNGNLLNLIKSNELNLATTIEFYKWDDASLDDVQLLLRQDD